MVDEDLFASHIWSCRSPVEVLLRGHLWIEHFFEQILATSLQRPAEIALDQMSWRGKLNLCAALGILGEDQTRALHKVNKMRNRLAHELAGEPARDDVEILLASSPDAMRDAVDQVRRVVAQPHESPEHWDETDPESALGTLRIWFFVEIMRLSYVAETAAFNKRHADDIVAAEAVRWAVNRNRAPGEEMSQEQAESRRGIPPRPRPGDFFRPPRHRGSRESNTTLSDPS